MMLTSELVTLLKTAFPTVTFYNGAINESSPTCVGVYARGSFTGHSALGGKSSESFGVLPVQVLAHWTENADTCQQLANSLYDYLVGKSNFMIGTRRIINIAPVDPCPIGIGRDENNICEITFRLLVYYNKEET